MSGKELPITAAHTKLHNITKNQSMSGKEFPFTAAQSKIHNIIKI